MLGVTGHCSALQSWQTSFEGGALCVCMCVRERFEGRGCGGEPGALRIRERELPGLEARAQVHHGRQWKALQKAIGLSGVDRAAEFPSHPAPWQPHLCSLPVQSQSLYAHPATLNYFPKARPEQRGRRTCVDLLLLFFIFGGTTALYIQHAGQCEHTLRTIPPLSRPPPSLLPLYAPSPGHLLPQRRCHCDAPH